MKHAQFRITTYRLCAFVFLLGVVSGCTVDTDVPWRESESGGLRIVEHRNGPTLDYSSTSGVKLLTDDGLAFKDLNQNGVLDAYEDWRLAPEERAVACLVRVCVKRRDATRTQQLTTSNGSIGGRGPTDASMGSHLALPEYDSLATASWPSAVCSTGTVVDAFTRRSACRAGRARWIGG